MTILLLVTPILAVSVVPAGAAMPVVLDTDLGDDIDDTWALAMLLGCPELDPKLIVTAAHDTAAKTRLVAKILERMRRTDIPIGTGLKTGDRELNQAAWLGDYSLDKYKGTVHEDGVQALIDVIKSSETPVTLIVIGPQCNIKEALRRDPSIAQKARVVAMAGSVHVGYDGKEGRSPEWNVVCDIDAARAVFAAPWEITMAPLDTCGILRLKGDRYRSVQESKGARALTLVENYDQWGNRKHYAQDSSSVLYDTLAVYLAFADACCEMETVKLSIDDKGNTVPDENGRPVRCALKWKDMDGFEQALIRTVTAE